MLTHDRKQSISQGKINWFDNNINCTTITELFTCLMFIVYVGNFIQALLLYFDMASFCERINILIKAGNPLQCFQYNMPMCAFLIYGNNKFT